MFKSQCLRKTPSPKFQTTLNRRNSDELEAAELQPRLNVLRKMCHG